MARKIDPEDLIDAAGVAEILGLSSRNAVGVYRGRYDDFPEPAVERGQCRLWLQQDILRWRDTRQGKALMSGAFSHTTVRQGRP